MKLCTKSIIDFLEEDAKLYANSEALVADTVSYTWKQVDDYSTALAYRMSKQGVQKNTHVGIWSTNNPNWVLTFLAICKLQAIPVLINTCYKEDELQHILSYADVEYLYYGKEYKNVEYIEVIKKIKDCLPKVKQYIYLGNESNDWYRESSFTKEELSLATKQEIRNISAKITSEDIAGMLFTSGTTSVAKGVLLTNSNIVNTALNTIHAMHWQHDDRICIALPLFHCFGVTSSMYSMIILGASMYLLPSYRSVPVLKCIEKNHCTILNGVPSMFLALVRNPQFSSTDLSSLKTGIIAGSTIFPKDFIGLSQAIPNMTLVPSYGQTETSPAVSFSPIEDSVEERSLNSGKILEGVQVRIADVVNQQEVPANKQGEIQVKGYNVMNGYYKLPEITRNVFSKDGWLHTGDLGRLDEQGYLYIDGRCSEMIIRGGENIAPAEIEDYIKQVEGIIDVAVIGIPAPIIQEKVVACIIEDPKIKVDTQKITEILKERIADFKIPEEYLKFTSFPTTSSGKLKKEELKKQAIEKLSTH